MHYTVRKGKYGDFFIEAPSGPVGRPKWVPSGSGPMIAGVEPLQFADREVAEDFAAALNVGRKERLLTSLGGY